MPNFALPAIASSPLRTASGQAGEAGGLFFLKN